MQDFYRQDFASKLTMGVVQENLLPQDNNARWLQYFYISTDEHWVGEKHLLEGSTADIPYDWAHANYHPGFREKLERFGYSDILLVESDAGNVVYSVAKNIDFATSVFDGPHRDSGLAKAARQAMSLAEGEVAPTDFSHHVPAYGRPTAFLASPVFDKGVLKGTVVIPMPIEPIGAIMVLSSGLGDSGEAMILGRDKWMRSQSRLSDTPTVLAR